MTPDHTTHRVRRYDRGVLRPPEQTPQGFLMAEGVPVLSGVYDYVVFDGTQTRIIKELIDAQTIRQDAGQIGRLPLTLHHPDEDVSPDNVGELGVGEVGERVTFVEDAQGGYAQVTVCIRRGDAIAEVNAGTAAELSFGYDVVIDPTPGVHPIHGRYDQRQVKRYYNHLALVDQARHGSETRLRTDGATLPVGAGIQLTPVIDRFTPPRNDTGGHMEFLRAMAAQLKVPHWDSLDEARLKSAIQTQSDRLIKVADSVEATRGNRRDMGAHELVADMIGAHAKEKEDFKHKMKAMQKENDAFKAAMADLQKEVDGYKAAMDEMKAAAEETATKADAADAAHKSTTTELQNKLDAAETAKAALETSVQTLTQQLADAEAAKTAMAKTIQERADAEALASMKTVATFLRVDLKTDAGDDKPLDTLRADCAASVFGAELPANFTADAIAGLLAPYLRRADAGELTDDASDPRYDAFRRVKDKATDPDPNNKARPSMRSRAADMHRSA